MKKVICILAFVILALPVCACAVQEVFLPNSRYAVDVPDWMDYNDPVDGVAGVDAYLSEDLEMYYISYPKEQAAERGMKGTARETVRSLRASGVDAEDTGDRDDLLPHGGRGKRRPLHRIRV